ncbi:MAG: bifunctional precorrin-2 dehydrogenase/sirohydrochlorin ferrochelatase, partial [Deltaproteobacteria bacterium]|nr:bifunctional precorrin-2 dehydrogenase/sirohydrochlorin ferrochelatase [Deltaproteobacteria bacterium]
MRYYPVNLDVQNRGCLVVGGGSVGERKVKTLLECGAR